METNNGAMYRSPKFCKCIFSKILFDTAVDREVSGSCIVVLPAV